MSFTLPWTINKFVSTNINNANQITGSYGNTCSLKVNGNTELDSDTIITHLGVNKSPSSTYAVDVSGNVNVSGNYYVNGTALNVATLSGNNTFTGTNTFSNLTYSNTPSSSSVTITNPNFQLPSSGGGLSTTTFFSGSSTTYAPNSATLTALGFTGWGISGTSYTIGIQSGTGGIYYTTYYPVGTQAVFIQGTATTMISQNYSLAPGQYIFTYQLQQNSSVPNDTLLVASVVTGSTTIVSSSPTYVGGAYPNWVTYKLYFVVSTTGTYFLKFNLTGSSSGGYILVSGVSLGINSGMSLMDSTNTSSIGASQSILNNVSVSNGLSITSGGIGVVGQVNMGTAYGTNNLAINTTMASTSGASSTSNLMGIGVGALQSLTSGSGAIGIGNGVAQFATSITDSVVIGGSCINDTNSTIIGFNVQAVNKTDNTLVGYTIGSGVGNYNTCLGSNIFQAYNGYGDVTPGNNVAIGYYSQFESGDSYNTSVGNYTLQNIYGHTHFNPSLTTQYNTAIGYNAGTTQNTLNNCSFLGANTDSTTNNVSNSTAVGYNAQITASNQIILGTATETTYPMGGLTIPSSKVLTLLGSITANSLSVTASQIGYLSNLKFSTANEQLFFGNATGQNITTGVFNTAFGDTTLTKLTTGNYNTCFGSNAGTNLPSSSSANTAIGQGCLNGTAGYVSNNNTAVGSSCMFSTTSASNNTAIGAESAYYLTAGNNNTFVGFQAGNNVTGNNNILIGKGAGGITYNGTNNNTLIGTNTDFDANGYTNSTALGYGSIITGSNQIILGTATETTYPMGGLNIPSGKNIQVIGQYLNSAIQITGTTNFSIATAPYYSYYNIATTQTATITCTLPSPVASLNGLRICFRKTNTNAIAINTSPSYWDYTGNVTQNNVLLTASSTTQQGMQISFICLLQSGTTYAWYRVP